MREDKCKKCYYYKPLSKISGKCTNPYNMEYACGHEQIMFIEKEIH
jgi:hypothetical protein